MNFLKFGTKCIKKLNEKSWQITGKILVAFLLIALGTGSFAQVTLLNNSLNARFDLGSNWYGEAYNVKAVASADDQIWGNVVLELVDLTTLPEAKVLLNGRQVADFTDAAVTVRVANGDVLSVDTTAYELPITVRIKNVSSFIDVKELNEFTVITKEIAPLGKILFK